MVDVHPGRKVFATVMTIGVAVSLWAIQTDFFPIEQGARPSYYLYGWPICFATCARLRWGHHDFSTMAFVINEIASVIMISATYVTFRQIPAVFLRIARYQVFAGIAGFLMVAFLLSGGLKITIETLLFDLNTDPSGSVGLPRLWEEIDSRLILPGIVAGMFSIGYAFVEIIAGTISAEVRSTLESRSSAGSVEQTEDVN